ncbi:MAG: hypothetical protein NTY90_04570 [Candidatus Micrarchaeota archaeon]|nr:hypothetical protein [Candidatus Micrarchaeota archaeon]
MENTLIVDILILAMVLASCVLLLMISLAQRNKKLFSAVLFLNYRRMALGWGLMFVAEFIFAVSLVMNLFSPTASTNDFVVLGPAFLLAACLVMYQSLSKYGNRFHEHVNVR